MGVIAPPYAPPWDAGIDDFEVAEETYRAAVTLHRPKARITLRQDIRVVHDTG